MKYFTADWHLFHRNMRIDKNLPMHTRFPDFDSLEEYHSYIIKTVNKYVSTKDTLYILGDLSLASSRLDMIQTANLLKQLNAKKIYLVKGNHDSSKLLKVLKREIAESKFEVLELGDYFKADKFVWHMTHYPLLLGNRPNSPRINIHGHIHDDAINSWNLLNVGIDSIESPREWEFGKPWSYDEILTEMSRRRELSVNLKTKNP